MKHVLTFAVLILAVNHVDGLTVGKLNVKRIDLSSVIKSKAAPAHLAQRALADAILPTVELTLREPNASQIVASSKSSTSKMTAPVLLATQRKHQAHEPNLNDVLERPNAGSGPDQATIGLMIMNFYGSDLKDHTFSVDMVLSTLWTDMRATRFIPEGRNKLSMAWSQALKLLWMPGIVVTNRDIEKYEIVSASVTIFRDGRVLRVERAQARIMMKYALEEYPFDTQDLSIKISSSKYMSDEVQLVAGKNLSGTDEKEWGIYDFEKWEVKTYDSVDGVLRKSRLALDLRVARNFDKYYEQHLIPTFITLAISWAVFYFPFVGPFITPRLALSILALLTFTNIMVKSSKELPGAAAFNWNDLLNQQIQTLMFVTIVLNIGTEITFHTLQCEDFAKMLNNQAKILLPGMSLLNLGVILIAGRHHWITLDHATMLTKSVVSIFVLGYFVYIGHGLLHAMKQPKSATDVGAATAAVVTIGAAAHHADAGDADCDM